MRYGGVVDGQVLRRLRPQPRRRRAGSIHHSTANTTATATAQLAVGQVRQILLVGLLLVGSCNVAVLVNAPRWPESAEEYGCETARLWKGGSENSCSKYRKQVGLAGEVWTPPMIDYMRTEFMTDCKGLVLSDPGLGSVAELFSATPLGVCVCATEFVMSNWTPVEFVKAGERPSTFGYELGGGITACLTERAD